MPVKGLVYYCLPFILAFTTNAPAQDLSYSQFNADRTYLNPGFAGIQGGVGITAISRMQWITIDGGYKNFGASLDLQIQHGATASGFALSVNSSLDGLLNYNTNAVGLTYAFIAPVNDYQTLHFGIRNQWVQHRIDWSKAVFLDQLDPVYGNIYPTDIQLPTDQVNFWDLDIGVVWRADWKKYFGNGAMWTPESSIGITISHLPSLLNEPLAGNSLLNGPGLLAPRLTVHAGFFFKKERNQSDAVEFAPLFKFDLQEQHLNYRKGLKVYTLGSYALYDKFFLGAFWQDQLPLPTGLRHTNALILIGGVTVPIRNFNPQFTRQKENGPRLSISLSTDINIGGLSVNSGNVYELAIRYFFGEQEGKGASNKKRYTRCPRNIFN